MESKTSSILLLFSTCSHLNKNNPKLKRIVPPIYLVALSPNLDVLSQFRFAQKKNKIILFFYRPTTTRTTTKKKKTLKKCRNFSSFLFKHFFPFFSCPFIHHFSFHSPRGPCAIPVLRPQGLYKHRARNNIIIKISCHRDYIECQEKEKCLVLLLLDSRWTNSVSFFLLFKK